MKNFHLILELTEMTGLAKMDNTLTQLNLLPPKKQMPICTHIQPKASWDCFFLAKLWINVTNYV